MDNTENKLYNALIVGRVGNAHPTEEKGTDLFLFLVRIDSPIRV